MERKVELVRLWNGERGLLVYPGLIGESRHCAGAGPYPSEAHLRYQKSSAVSFPGMLGPKCPK